MLDRRQALLGLTSAAAFAPHAFAGRRSQDAAEPDLFAWAEALRRAERDEAFELAAGWLADGAAPQTVLGAVFLAAVFSIRPEAMGGPLHAVMMVDSACHIADASDPATARISALWCLNDFKKYQAESGGTNEWLYDSSDVPDGPAERAAADFARAMDAWDAPAADRAIVQALRGGTRKSVFELIWPYAGRQFIALGHPIVYAAQTERMLFRMPWKYAEPAVRALVRGLLSRPEGIPGRGPGTAGYEVSREVAAELPDTWSDGMDEPARSGELLKSLREASIEDAARGVGAALRGGVGTQTVWDGLRLVAAELVLRRREDGPLTGAAIRAAHAMTEVHAFAYAWRAAHKDETRRLLMVQAGAWNSMVREHLLWRDAITMDGPNLDSLQKAASSESGDFAELFDEPSAARACAYLRSDGDGAGKCRAELALHLHKGVEDHQFKFGAAVFEESRLTHPMWVPLVLAPAFPYLPSVRDEHPEPIERAHAALTAAGLG